MKRQFPIRFGAIAAAFLAIPLCDASSGYAGSKACAGCHREITDTFSQSAMAKSSGPVRAGDLEEGTVRTKAGVVYSASARDGSLVLNFVKRPSHSASIEGSKTLSYFIGSGEHARGLVFKQGGQLFQSPIAYFGARRGWDLAPGYENEPSIFLSRKLDSRCLSCHTSGSMEGEGGAFQEPGVSCERCHGPGSAHIEAAQKGRTAGGIAMVNPQRLAPENRDSICAQCHLAGMARIAKPGRSEMSYRPGERLSESIAIFIESSSKSPLKVIGHFEGLAQSQCKLQSGDRMWCGTCHDPHRQIPKQEATTYYREKCLVCHEAAACAAPKTARLAVQDSCATCHMPTRAASDGQHTVFTDHQIRRRPQDRTTAKSTNALVPFWPGSATPRDYALAEFDRVLAGSDRDALKRMMTRLKSASDGGADADVNAKLGFLADLNGDSVAAQRYYSLSLLHDPSELVALSNLAVHKARAGNLGEAAELWRKALQIDPGLEGAGLNLARAQLSLGKTAEARQTVDRILGLYPDSDPAHKLLEQLVR